MFLAVLDPEVLVENRETTPGDPLGYDHSGIPDAVLLVIGDAVLGRGTASNWTIAGQLCLLISSPSGYSPILPQSFKTSIAASSCSPPTLS